MSGSDDVVRAAALSIFAGAPQQFIAERKRLAAAAKANGDQESAKLIAALRKPTRAAQLLNGLARAEPELIADLLELADRMRRAQDELDGPALRELGGERRSLVGRLLERAGAAPSGSVLEEMNSTLNSALSDERVAGDLQQGLLVSAQEWSGFPSAGLPPEAAGESESSPSARAGRTRRSEEADRKTAAAAAAADELIRVRSSAQEAADAADRAGSRLAAAQQRVDQLSSQLAAAQDDLAAAGAVHRRAQSARREARQAVDRQERTADH